MVRRSIMIQTFARSAVLLPFLLLPAAVFAAAEEAKPDALAILRQARYTAALQEGEINGRLAAENSADIPFHLAMTEGRLTFTFRDPDETIALDLGDDAFRFSRATGGQLAPLPQARYADTVRGTDLTYEDLALRFLFWQSAEVLGVERVKDRQAWKIRINNPRRDGIYAVVYAWIDRQTAALMRVQGYNWEGRCVKQFEVTDVMKVGDNWMLKTMRVETIDGNNKVSGRTYLRLDKPVPARPPVRRPAWN
jgi:hypothetical protein